MAAENLQKWKAPFEAQFWRSELVHATLLDSIKRRLGNLDIYLKPGSKERVDGHFFVTVNNPDNSKNFVESEVDAIKKSNFEEFKKILRLQGIKSEIKWNEIEPVELSSDAPLTVGVSLTPKWKNLRKPIPFTDAELESISRIYDKIQDHESKDTISNILDLVCLDASDDAQSFFYRWISFNLVYSYRQYNLTERCCIEKFACNFSSCAGSPPATRYAGLFNTLVQENLVGRNEHDRFSELLQGALDNDNAEDIWKYAFLCTYSIRNQFFHKNKKSAHFENLSEFLADVVVIALREIFQLK